MKTQNIKVYCQEKDCTNWTLVEWNGEFIGHYHCPEHSISKDRLDMDKERIKEFNLSDRIVIKGLTQYPHQVINILDVKEFIRLIKQKINPNGESFDKTCCPSCMNKRIYLDEIDELAGDKLI